MGEAKSAIIIGGGIIGVTGAYALAREGWQVRLIDALPDVGLGATLGNGRQLSYSHTNALASPALIKQIPRLVLGLDDAFRIRLKLDRHFVSWVMRFLAQCTASRNRRNTLAGLKLAEESRRAMERLQECHPIEFDNRKTGKFVLLRGEREVEGARSGVAAKQAEGVDQRLLTSEEAFAIEPALANASDPIDAAIFTASDESGDGRAFAANLLRTLGDNYGVEFDGGTAATRLDRRGDASVVTLANGEELSADLAVVSSGYRSNALLGPLGLRLPIEPMKGYSFTAPLGNAAPLASVTDAKRRIVFTHLGDRMLVAGIAEMGRVDDRLDPARLASMMDAARASLPEAAVYSDASPGWTGMRPMTPNSLPITRMLAPGIAANTGHGMLGWTMAMGSAQRLAKAVGAAA
ncbi:MAG: FAD-dependent oxidoreductase [Pseudomonadota bacterium]